MKNLALELPGIGRVQGYPFLKPELSGGDIGSIISAFLSLTLLIGGFLMFIWFVWGVFEYIFAGGNKDALGKARKRMTWAIVGFLLFALSFAVSQYASTIFKPTSPIVPESIQRNPSTTTPANPNLPKNEGT
jgi:vacuolar-type H+-ATPase subunit I/STV1